MSNVIKAVIMLKTSERVRGLAFLPINRAEMEARGWERPDIVLITGDSYVDHSSFGTAIISRVLEARGYKVCILPQPQCDGDYLQFGTPRLAFYINGGNIDSMVAHYTAAKRKRSDDAYTAGGRSGKRPDRAVTVYTKAVRRLFGAVPIAIGGIEASLRRFAHYDYWDDKVRPSVLIESGADLLMFGMGERQAVEIADRLANGEPVRSLTDIKGTCYAVKAREYMPAPCAECPSYEQVSPPTDSGKRQYAVSCRIQQSEHDAVRGKRIIQRHGDEILVQNKPQPPLSTAELDGVYGLPYERNWHPSYDALGGVPALQEVKFSITHNRGCFGACNFCSIAYHQGRAVTCRSEQSVIDEARLLTGLPDFKGYIHDVGGPTANFRGPSCDKQAKAGLCKDRKCLAPTPCPALKADHREYLNMLRRLRAIDGVKKVFIRSGIRFDYLIEDNDEQFFRELVAHHVSGQLKVAPEHCSAAVLQAMGKPQISAYMRFKERYYELTKSVGKKQYLVPYLMSSHPGSTLNDAVELALFLKKEGLHPEQVQDFYPTPSTVSTCMFYTGLDPMTLKEIYVPRSPSEKAQQRALLQYFKPENRQAVLAALRKCGRTDLIGTGQGCLVNDFGAAGSGSRARYIKPAKKNIRSRQNKRGVKH